jgi:midasin
VAIKSIESNPTLQDEIFTEARDVFLGSLPLPSHPLRLAEDEVARDRYSVVGKVLASGEPSSLLS